MTPIPHLILASGSPRRSDLLREAGYQFVVSKPDVEELEDGSVPIRELTAHNALLKAGAVAKANPDAVIIAADTLVLLGETVLSKPADRAEASRMIRSLNGNTHQVFTAVAVLQDSSETRIEFSIATEVTFKNLIDAELDHYHSLIEPMDKAGAYAAQDHGEIIIDQITGSMTNVIGLPMDEVKELLETRFGIVLAST